MPQQGVPIEVGPGVQGKKGDEVRQIRYVGRLSLVAAACGLMLAACGGGGGAGGGSEGRLQAINFDYIRANLVR